MSRYRRMPQFVPATWRSLAAANINADLPSGYAPTARFLRHTSRNNRSSGLFVRRLRQFHLFQLRGDLFRFLTGSSAIFLRVNGLEHRRDFRKG